MTIMTIQNVTLTTKELTIVIVDPEGKSQTHHFHPDLYSEYFFYEGKEIPLSDWKKMIAHNQDMTCRETAYKLLSRSSYSAYELKKKLLERKFAQEQVERIVRDLQKQHLVDDERYAKDMVEYLHERLYGEEHIKHELLAAGIAPRIRDQFSFSREHEQEKLVTLMRRSASKWSKLSFREQKRKWYDYLLRRGFSSDIIHENLSQVLADDPQEEYQRCQEAYRHLCRRSDDREKPQMVASLMRKGFRYDIIKQVMEEDNDEMD